MEKIKEIYGKIPAASIVVPMVIAALINSLIPGLLNIGATSGAIATEDGLNTLVAITLLCVGGQLTIDRLRLALGRGLTLFLAKWLTSLVLGYIFFRLFGPAGIFGISALAFVAAISNHNNTIFIAMTRDYGDEYDLASAAITAIISVPIFTFISLSMLGIADISPESIIDLILPLAIGIGIGNLDKSVSDFLSKAQAYTMPFLGFAIGAGIDLMEIFEGGPGGLILAFMTIASSFLISLPADRLINKRPGWAAISTYTTAGNALVVPSLVATIDPTWESFAGLAQAQLGTAVILTSIFIPIVAGFWHKKFGG